MAWRVASYILVASIASVATALFYTSTMIRKPMEATAMNIVSRVGRLGYMDASAAAQLRQRAASRSQGLPAASSSGGGGDGATAADPQYRNRSGHPICSFLESGRVNPLDELHWGAHDMCNMTVPAPWLRKAGTNCYSCISGANVCRAPPTIIYHQYLDQLHPSEWQGNLLSFKAYLMTQDLEHTEMWLWTSEVDKVVNNNTAPFFDAFQQHIKVKRFDYDTMLRGTLWEGDPFLGNSSLVRRHMQAAGALSDLLRLLILWPHGGFWMDNDVLLLRDVYPLLSVSYQFSLRWTNAHVMLMQRQSQVLERLMYACTTIPLNHPNFQQEIIQKKCNPVGYFQVSPGEYANTHIYNASAFRLVRHHNNSGPPQQALHDMPLGWWDQVWPNCHRERVPVTDTTWRTLATNYLAMHTRYPKRTNLPAGCPTQRGKAVIDAFFSLCSHAECVPLHGADLLEYEGVGQQLQRRHAGQRRLLARREYHQQ